MMNLTSLRRLPVILIMTVMIQSIRKNIFRIIACASILMSSGNSFSQVFCSGDTPYFVVDLSASPTMTWLSPAVQRDGECCGGGADQVNCIEFSIILAPGAIGINFTVASGANPGGALFYQYNCSGTPTSSGFEPIVCLDGPGPHYLSYCKVGNNTNTYEITSIPGPIPPNDIITSEGCEQQLTIQGTDPASVTWTSISPGTPGQYNDLLSDLSQTANGTSGVPFSGYNDVLVTPTIGSPGTIQYEVCGSAAGACMTQPFCDTVSVTVVPELAVNITPAVPYLCFGQPFVTLTANVVGGLAPYTYLWSNGETTSSVNVTDFGNYSVTITDATGCPIAVDDVTVIEFVNPITADAGPDLVVCAAIASNIQVNGSVTGVTTGIWSGGTGTYSTSNTDLSLEYTMSAAEIAAGSATLTLTTTNNGTCPGDSDDITITVTEMTAVLDNLQNVSCFGGANGSAIVSASAGVAPYSYSLNGAPAVASNTFNGLAAGAYSVVVSDAVGCSATVNFDIIQPAQLTFGTVVQNVSCFGVCDGEITINALGGTPPYSYSGNYGTTFGPSNLITGLCAGTAGIVVQDASGCLTNSNVLVTEPAALSATYTLTPPICNGQCNGEIDVNASGGTVIYQYSANGGPLQPSLNLINLCSGNNTILVQDANGCQLTSVQTLINPPAFQIDTVYTAPSFCGFNNGSLEVIADGLNGPFSYSMEGGPGQPTGEYTNLFAGAYSFVATDALGCQAQAFFGVNDIEMDGIIIEITDALCYGGADGYIEVINSSGINPITFELDNNGFPQASGIFLDVSLGSHVVTIADSGACIFTLPFTINEPDEIQFTSTSTEPSCLGGADGTITFENVIGGMGDYEYSLDGASYQASPTFTGLTAGTYDLYVMDSNNCVVSQTQIVTEPAAVDFEFYVSDLTCFGVNTGVIQLAATGGDGNYTYSIDNGVTFGPSSVFFNLPGGSYDVVVQDGAGCTASGIVDIFEPLLLTSTYTPTPVTCFGTCDGQISFSASGGTPTYYYSTDNGTTFSVNPIATLLCEGSYDVQVVDDNGCQVTSNVIITTPTIVDASGITNPSTCGLSNGSIDADAIGGTPAYTYSIDNITFDPSPSFGGLAAGAYTVYAMDNNGCVETELVIVDNEPSPVITGTLSSDVSCNGVCDGTITISSIGGTGVVQYSIGGAYQVSNVFSGLCAGLYDLSITDANGCVTDAAAPIEIFEPNILVFDFVFENLLCFQNGTGLVEITASGGTPDYAYSNDNGATFGSDSAFYFLDAVTYDLVVQDANGCQATDMVSLTQPPLMEIVDIVTTDVVCFGFCNGTANASAQGGTVAGDYNYYWSQDTLAIGTSNPITDLCPNIYHAVLTDDNGCWDSLNFEIFEPIPMAIDSVLFTDPVCFNACDGTIDIYSSTAVSFSFDGGTTFGASSSATNLCEGQYYVAVQDADGCLAYDSLSVLLINPPLINIDAGIDQTVCEGTAVTLSGALGVSYVWDNGVTDGVPFTPVVGTITYTVTGTDANGCTNTDQVDVTVNPLPVVNAGVDQTVCEGTAVTLNGVGAVTYVWDNGVTDGVPFVPVVGTLTYTVTGTDANGCFNTDQVDVTVNPLPVVSAGVDQQACAGSAITLTGSGATSYLWNNGVTDGVPFGQGVGTTTYTVTGTDANGCSNTDQVDFTIYALPIVNAGADQSVCEGTSVTLSGAGATSYVWNQGVSNGVPFVPAIGTLTYTVIGTDVNGCSNSDDAAVTVNPPPVVGAGADQIVCEGTAVTINGSGANSYVWDNGVTNGVAFVPAVGTVTYTVTGTDANGCINTDQLDITVNPVPAVNAGADQEVCEGTTVTLNGSGAVSYTWNNGAVDGVPFVQAVGAITYTITGTGANGCINTDEVIVIVNPNPVVNAGADQSVCDGTMITVSSVGTPNLSWNNGVTNNVPFQQGIGTMTYTVTDSFATGCTSSDDLIVQVLVNPVVTTNDDVICEGEGVTLNGVGAVSYSWSGGVVNGVEFFPSVDGTYTVTGTAANGCTAQATANIVVHPAPVVYFKVLQLSLTTLSPTTGFDNLTTGAVSYSWDFGDGSANTTEFEPVHTFPSEESGEYEITLTAYSDYGCPGIYKKYVHVFLDYTIYVPNAFTPDNNGDNEIFKPVMEGFDPDEYTLYIFNRWGNLVFESHNMDIGWDGTINQKVEQVQDGVYTWKVVAGLLESADTKIFVGHVSLLK